ncbi:MAG: ROK family protein [Candidatus Aminicenantes bacterium]|nr:ROK family protein [Candidatus Aminicenantes bacterium]
MEEKKKRFCGAVDVGGTKISSALFTPEGNMLGKGKVAIDSSRAEKPAEQIIGIIIALEECARSEKGELAAIGIDIPGVVFHRTGRVWAPNIPGWEEFPLREKVQEKVKLPLTLESDRSAYVSGEQWQGIAKGLENVVFLAVGTGIGAGLIIEGRLCHGSEDISGAVGWFALSPELKDKYSEIGCFEAEASGNSVARKAREFVRAGESSLLTGMVKGNIENITAETVVEAAQQNDPVANKVIDSAIRFLGMGIANIVSILNPEMVVLGGGLFQAGQVFLEPVRNEFKKWAQPLAAQKVRIELSSLGEDAGLYGAGKLAWDQVE